MGVYRVVRREESQELHVLLFFRDIHTSLSGARSSASSSALFFRVKSAPSLSRATAVSPEEQRLVTF